MPTRPAARSAGPRKRRKHDHQDEDLADFDADVEREQRNQQMGARELEVLLQAVREAEAVHQAEQASDQHAPFEVDAHDVLERHVDDRCGDRRLDEGREPCARRREIEGRAQQRERMRDREDGDDRQDLPPAAQRNHQAKQEQQMIVAGEDVRDAEPDEAGRGANPAWG